MFKIDIPMIEKANRKHALYLGLLEIRLGHAAVSKELN